MKKTPTIYRAVATTTKNYKLVVDGSIHDIRAEVRMWLDLIGEPYAGIRCVAANGRVLLSGVRCYADRHLHVATATVIVPTMSAVQRPNRTKRSSAP